MTPPTSPRRRPRQAADQRKADIVAATVQLLAESGPDRLTVRQIAERAGVQHPLIYRHFGDKATLVAVAMVTEMQHWAQVVRDNGPDPEEAFVAGFRHLAARPQVAAAFRMTVVGEAGIGRSQQSFPTAETHAELLVAAGLDLRAARALAVTVMAIIAGWVGGEDFWLAGAGRTDDPAAARTDVEHHLRLLVRAALADAT